MAAEATIINSQPGVRRDGTPFSATTYREAVWTRFQRGLPKSMGGYASIERNVAGPTRGVFLDSRLNTNSAHYFSRYGIQRQLISDAGVGSPATDRTPASFDSSRDYTWTYASMFSSTGGAYSALIAAATPDVADLASDDAGPVLSMGLGDDDVALYVADQNGTITTSGGVVVLQPFLFVYGSNGLIRNSNANDFSAATGWQTGGSNLANSNNVSATKIAFAAQIRGGGQTPAGLFWALDSLIRVGFVGGTQIWNYDPISAQSTIMSKRCVVEIDGRFFWPGIDRFFLFNGVLQELENTYNQNWFFNNINRAAANKVWGTPMKRWGEIWWFYPSANSDECDLAVIYNYRENVWYDAAKTRSAGDSIGSFRFPVWVGAEDSTAAVDLAVGDQTISTAAVTPGAVVIPVADTSLMVVGRLVVGSGIPAGTTITSRTGVDITVSAPTTGVPLSTRITCSTVATALPAVGATVTGGTSAATGVVVSADYRALRVSATSGTFTIGETVSYTGGTAVLLRAPSTLTLSTSYIQEVGQDKVIGPEVTPLQKSYTTADFGLAVAGSLPEVKQVLQVQTKIERITPDFVQSGELQVEVLGRDMPKQQPQEIYSGQAGEETTFLAPRAEARLLNLRVTSDEAGGLFEVGRVIINVEPGGGRTGITR